jgi:hypothetical protein
VEKRPGNEPQLAAIAQNNAKNLAHVAKMLWRSHYRGLRLYGSCESFLCDAA